MKAREYFNRPGRAAYVFLLPSLLTLFVFSFIPMGGAIAIGLMKLDIYFTEPGFAGLSNFIKLMGDERFWNAFKNTLVFAVTEVTLQIVIGLLAANALAGNLHFNKIARSILFVPAVISMTSIGITFCILMDSTIGLVPYLLNKYLGIPEIGYFRDIRTAMPAVVTMTVWKNFGYTMSILVVGINNISRNYYEASDIDGASKVKQFFYITIPCLLPNLGFCLITNVVGSLQVFDQVYVTTRGGPQYRTETLVHYIYKTGFSGPFDLGYSSAMSVVLMVFIIIASLSLYLKMFVSGKE
jgi:multiple sugar transport system permease protein